MTTRTSDRAHMHDDLRELARLASAPKVAPASSSAPAFESADSSGYVDLSAFSATDDGWVDRELERAKGRVVLTPGSLRPISMEALLEVEPEESKPSRTRTWVYSGLGLVGAGLIALLAVTMSRHPPASPAKAVAESPAVVAQPPVATTAPAAAQASVAATASAAPVASVVIVAPDLTPTSKRHTAAHRATPASAPAHVAVTRAAAPRPVVIPAPAGKSGGGGDSLMDAIRASVKK